MKSNCWNLLLLATLSDVVGAVTLSAQGFHWSYGTQVTQRFDAAPGQKVPSAPAPEFAPYPAYPWEMVRARVTGKVTLEFTVVADGHVVNVRVIKTSQKEFSDPAIEAVKSWRFFPLAKNATNYPSSVVVVCAFTFELPEE